MRVLITGSEGVLGTALKQELCSRGHQVFGCDLAHSPDPNFMRADIRNHRELGCVFGRFFPDAVINLAAEFGRLNGVNYPEAMLSTNILGTHNVIDWCSGQQVLLIHASSSEAYGRAQDYAQNDEPFREDWLDKYAPQFDNEYAASKWFNERQITLAARNSGLRTVVIRPFNIYGQEPYTPYRSVVCQFIYQMLHDLPITVYHGSRTHMWIGDFTTAIANILDHQWMNAVPVPVFNIGDDQTVSNLALKDMLLELIPETKSTITVSGDEPANIRRKAPDISRMREWLYAGPHKPLMDGLRETVEWMRERYHA